MIAALLLSLLVIAGPGSDRGTVRIAPVDQCAADPSFAEFRDGLRRAIAGRDREQILASVVDDIEIGFGGDRGRADFARAWALERPQTSPLWHELEEALRLGCAVDADGSYWSPSLFLAREVDDPFGTMLAIQPGAALHAAPDTSSGVVAALDWDLLTVLQWEEGAAWQLVQLSDGRSGYVRTEALRSPVDYRAGFRRIDGSWRMIAFLAGD